MVPSSSKQKRIEYGAHAAEALGGLRLDSARARDHVACSIQHIGS
jgi:hypothetical protein